MKSSITQRLFFNMVSIVLAFTVLILIANTLLLRPLYEFNLKKTMETTIDQLVMIDYEQTTNDWIADVSQLNLGKSFDIVIVRDEQIVFSSSTEIGLRPRPETQLGPTPENLNIFLTLRRVNEWDELKNESYVGVALEPRSNKELMICLKTISDDITVYLTQPIEPLQESVQQANILLCVCAGLFLGIVSLLAFKLAQGFTKPIRHIQRIVGEISSLNFDEVCDIQTGDEMEDLGRDINSLSKKLQEALATLRKQNKQLERNIRVQKQFISNASHELRTPLSLIKGYADEINAGFVSDQEQAALYVNIIAQEADKMNRLLKEMLDLSRLEGNTMQFQNKNWSVNEQIMLFLDKYDGFISEKGLHITLDLAPQAEGYFDVVRFEQVLANYISNAARYGDAKKQVRISTEIQDQTICISVYNSGKPISEEVISHIWDSFYKADEARTRIEGSYGLGLSIVKTIQDIAEQQYGAYNVEDGVVFWFTVKRA